MPTWSGILAELHQAAQAPDPQPFDTIRRKYLASLTNHTGRNVVLYATKWTQPDARISPEIISIVDEDVQGLMEVVHGLDGNKGLDLILHSPGGSPEAAEAFVTYLRSKFTDIRVVVPHLAMSAATMVACAADVILMGKHSFLGPIDPQMILQTPLGLRAVPAQAVLAQFDRAVRECQDPAKLAAWLPILGQYGPDLLNQCEAFSVLASSMVQRWLQEYMFRGLADAESKAKAIAEWLADRENFRSHSKHISRWEAEGRGLRIKHLEADQKAQDLFLSVFHATTHTFNGTPAAKIIENQLGKAFIKIVAPGQQPVMLAPQGAGRLFGLQ
jgi:hypothetical protein